jgi:hypothetical protein
VKKRIITFAVAAAVGGATAVPASWADDGGGLVSGSYGVSAFFSSTSGCITTQATIRADRDSSRAAAGLPETVAALELNRFDTCLGGLPLTPFYREDSIALPASALKADGMGRAQLDVTLPLQEQNTGEVRPVAFHLTWNGAGAKTAQKSVTAVDGVRTRTAFTARSAVADGTISDGTASFVGAPTSDAELHAAFTRVSGSDASDD